MASLFRTLTLVLALVPASAALAQNEPSPPSGDFHQVREACREDIARLCKDVQPGGGRIRECLRAHQDEVSEGCKVAVRDAQAHHHPRADRN